MRFKEVELKDICLDMHQGINTVADKVEYQNEGVPIIQSKNITSGYLDLEDVRYLDDETYVKYKDKYNPQKGDILLCNIGTIGASLVLNQDNKFLIAWNLFKLKINKELYDPKYIKYYLEKLRRMNYFNRLLTGGTVKFINKTKMGEIKIPICNLHEQYKIVKILDKAQELIDKRKAQIEALDELVKSRFIEMFCDENYPIVKTEDVCEYITKGTTPKTNDIVTENGIGLVPYLKVYNLSFDGSMLFEEKPQYVSEEIHNKFLSRSRVFPNDVLMNIVGPPLGKFAIVPNMYKEWNINQAIAIFRATNRISPIYLLYALKQPNVLRPFIDSAVGIRQQNLSLLQCRNLEIPLPPIELQNQFATFVKQVDKLKFEMQKSLEELENLFNSLMQKAFNGELFNYVND